VTATRCCLLTGATGFIGRRLARRLQEDGWEVHAVVRNDRQPQLPAAVIAHPDSELAAGHLGCAPLVVFHLATKFTKEHSFAEIPELVAANLLLPLRCIEAAIAAGCRNFITTGTAWQHFGGNGLRAANLYAATKQAADDLLGYYADAGKAIIASLHLTDTYGPEDPRPKLFRLLRQHSASGEPLAMTAGEQEIDLLYVDDAVDAFIAMADHLLAGRQSVFSVYGTASGQIRTVRQVVELWQQTTGLPLTVNWGAIPYRQREVMTVWRPERTVPGWIPKTDLATGIRRIERSRV